MGTSLVVQWLRLRAPNAGGPGSILGQGSNNRPHMLQLKIPRAATKTLHSQRNTYLKKRRSEYHHNPLLQADLGDVGSLVPDQGNKSKYHNKANHTHWFPSELTVQFSRSVVSDCLRPHELQHARPPCPSSTPGVYLNSCPLSW